MPIYATSPELLALYKGSDAYGSGRIIASLHNSIREAFNLQNEEDSLIITNEPMSAAAIRDFNKAHFDIAHPDELGDVEGSHKISSFDKYGDVVDAIKHLHGGQTELIDLVREAITKSAFDRLVEMQTFESETDADTLICCVCPDGQNGFRAIFGADSHDGPAARATATTARAALELAIYKYYNF